MSKDIVKNLLDLPDFSPETKEVRLPRLGVVFTLRELGYDQIMKRRGEKDATIHYLLDSVDSPKLRDRAWFEEHMGCPSPVEAVKKLLRAGEIEALCKEADRLNGYGWGSVVSVKRSRQELEQQAVGAALEELEKN